MNESDVPNRLREAIGESLAPERLRVHAAEHVFTTVQDALANGAWSSSTADRFADRCAEQQRLASEAARTCYAAIENRYDREPERVEAFDRRAQFSG